MQFQVILASLTALLAVNVGAAAVENESSLMERAALIATDPYYACNCPNNCKHKERSSCKFKAGPSTSSDTISGKCQWTSGTLVCIAT